MDMNRLLNELERITNNSQRDFRKLLEKVWDHAVIYSQKYSEDDIRCDFFKVYSILNAWLQLQLEAYREMLKVNDTKLQKVMSLQPNDRIQFLMQYDTINRASYCTKAMFEVEHFLSILCNSLNNIENRTYSQITKNVLNSVG